MRPFQGEVLRNIEEVLDSSKFIILEAPVGFGKSAIAVSMSRYLDSAHILTSTKQLQDQYTSDYGYPVIKGKSNFRCLVPTSSKKYLPCNEGRCEVDWSLKDCPHYVSFEDYVSKERSYHRVKSGVKSLRDGKLCRYYAQKWSGFKAPITVYNYPFIFSEISFSGDIPYRNLLVCDEAHDLEKQIVNFASFTIRKDSLENYYNILTSDNNFSIKNKGDEESGFWLEVIKDIVVTLQEFYDKFNESAVYQEKIVSCKNLVRYLESLYKNLKTDPENWVVNSLKTTEDGEVEEVVFQPISVADYSAPLFSIAKSVLLMSATISSKKRFCKVLGINEEEASLIPIKKSSFPISNRPIHALNTVRLNRRNMSTSLQKITQSINEILDRHKSERGIIHTTSYSQANYIIQNVSQNHKDRLVTTEKSFDRSVLLRIHGSNDASVLISPSLYQGIDLKNDFSRFQIIIKVPYPDLSQKRIREKLQKDREWYDWQTALRLVQTYGRSVRTQDDFAVTYILDSNFSRFIKMHHDLLPDFFLEALN